MISEQRKKSTSSWSWTISLCEKEVKRDEREEQRRRDDIEGVKEDEAQEAEKAMKNWISERFNVN